MFKQASLIRAMISGAFVVGAAAVATSAFAADEHAGDEQCAGVIKAGKNDCATARNECHGHVLTDADSMAWIYVPKGTCERIAGAHLVKVKDPTPSKS